MARLPMRAWFSGAVLLMALTAACTSNNPAKPSTSALSGSSIDGVHPLPAGLSRLPSPQVAPPVTRSTPATVSVDLEAKQVVGLLDDKVAYEFWTFGGTVPGPMVRVRVGDTVNLTLRNNLSSTITHSIDSHGITGPGGGAKYMQVSPGASASIQFKALNPGVYVYHCATPLVAHHISNGMYGLMVVEPEGGFDPVDKEFYVMQGDFYLEGNRGQEGLHDPSIDKLHDENPDYVCFNGSVGSLTGDRALHANVGDKVRIFFGVGGPNLTSSFHLIGEIFDKVYPEGASEYLTNVQSTLVPTGGSTIVQFKLDVPGNYTLVDHSLGRMDKGAVGTLVASGSDNPDVFKVIQPGNGVASGH